VNAANAANVKPSDGCANAGSAAPLGWTFFNRYPGVKPRAKSFSPFWTKFAVQMNRSRPAICRSSQTGFTLLEICFVLFIVAVLFAVSAPPVAKQFQEEQIRKPVRELQTFAKTARRLAMEQNRAYVVLLLNNGFLLEPLEKKDTDRESLRYDLPNHVTFEIQRPADRALQRIADARWVFAPNGLCEPITFFFQRDQDWVRFRIDALTARIENEESFIR
jgi:type II secretory pathway pseudopilin PulG